MSTLQVVVGAQYGSEAKGHVTDRLNGEALGRSGEVYNVRVAGPNAGHTVYDHREGKEGFKYALRQIPVGGARPGVRCLIAAGSEIDPEVLFSEITMLREAGLNISGRLWIDPEATLITTEDKQRETGLVGSIGSTGKGVGAARASRLMRQAVRVKDHPEFMDTCNLFGVRIVDTAAMLRLVAARKDTTIVIEGTQGFGLGMHAGHYPRVTSSDCRALDFLAMAGVSPWQDGVAEFEVWAVARVYPIRVAGNSGPLQDETTWEALGLPPEYTTVTRKERRVGLWDGALVWSAVQANGGAPVVRLAITMLDQKWPDLAGRTRLSADALDWLEGVADEAGAPVALVTTGPDTAVWL